MGQWAGSFISAGMSGSSSEVRIMPVQSSFRRSMTGRWVQPSPRISAIFTSCSDLSWGGVEGLFPPPLTVLRVVGVPVGVAQNAAGQCPGVLALLVEHLAVDDGGKDTLSRLLDAPGALGEVADDDLVTALHGRWIEDHDVGGDARVQQPAVIEPEGRGRVEGQP